MKKTAFLFSGQGSQYLGMGQALVSKSAAAAAIYEEAASLLDLDILNLDEQALQDTRYAQLASFCLSIAAYRALEESAQHEGFELHADAVAGFSLGEYAALTITGAISFTDALKLIQFRAQVMSDASLETKGAMYAILGLDDASIIETLEEENYKDQVFPANYNSPGQLVIAGYQEATAAAAEALLARGAKRAVRLNVSGAFHTNLMATAATALEKEAAQYSFGTSSQQVFSNVTAESLDLSRNMPAYLATHMISPVRWTRTVEHMKADGFEQYIEFGPGKTLIGLVKRVDRQAKLLNVEDPASLEATIKALVIEA